nr:unnamed protein product [Callosobruchus analis]
MARKNLQEDMKEAATNPYLEAVCYDMEKVLGLPKLPTKVVYYKRQLSIYNEGIHVGSTNTPYAFIWKEGVAGRGAQEVGSCLKKFIATHLKSGAEELILWSDKPFCGANYGSRRLFSTEDIEKSISNRKKSTQKEKISWLKTKVIKLGKDKPFSIFLKETHDQDEQYKEIDISKQVQGRKSSKELNNLKALYPTGKAMFQKKAEDIKTLMRFIPLDARPFYKIVNVIDFEDDIDGYGQYLDFEVETDS